MAPFVPGPRTLALVQIEGGPSVGDIADSKNDAELRTLEAYEAAGGLLRMVKNESTVLFVLCFCCSGKKQKKEDLVKVDLVIKILQVHVSKPGG